MSSIFSRLPGFSNCFRSRPQEPSQPLLPVGSSVQQHSVVEMKEQATPPTRTSGCCNIESNDCENAVTYISIGASLNTILNLMGPFLGAEVLSSAGCMDSNKEYVINDTKMQAMGCAITGTLYPILLMNSVKIYKLADSTFANSPWKLSLFNCANATLSGLVGYACLASSNVLTANFAASVAKFSLGGAVTSAAISVFCYARSACDRFSCSR